MFGHFPFHRHFIFRRTIYLWLFLRRSSKPIRELKITFHYLDPIDVLNNSASLLVPTPPPGFRLYELEFDPEDYVYAARETWLGLVGAASQLARYGSHERPPYNQRFNLVISHAPMIFMLREHTTYGTLVWAIWGLGRYIALLYPMPNNVPRFFGKIQVAAGLAGLFYIELPPNRIAVSSNHSDVSSIAASRRRDVIVKPTLRADRGRKTCHDDPDLVIHYQFLGRELFPGQVFTAFLTAQTYFSEYESERRDVTMVAFSVDRRVRLGVHGVHTGPGSYLLTWGLARIGVRTVWHLVMGYSIDMMEFVDEMRWESVSFVLEYRGVGVGQGSLGW